MANAEADDERGGRHAPHAVDHAGHAHPDVDLTHPIVAESPLPETHVRFDYSFSQGAGERGHELAVSAEYAFAREASVEASLPYAFVDSDDAGRANHLGDAVVAVKFATYRFAANRLLPAAGVELALPTGNEERGIGSDHVVELEPFLRLGHWAGPLEFIANVSVGLPLNRDAEEDEQGEDVVLGYNLSSLYHLTPDAQLLLELVGDTVFGGASDASLSLSPGVTFQPFEDKAITIGVGASVPLGDGDAFDYAVHFMTLVHF